MKQIFCRSFSILFLSILFWTVLAGKTNAQTATYAVRNLTLDTLGKTVLLESDASNFDGKLTELTDGKQVLKDWKIKYEHKGSMRHECEPPVLNLSFDKTDSKGKPKALFNGVSTYPGYPTLQYQKLRLIPECDGWNDWGHVSSVGFSGQLNVSLREFIIFKVFRKFGVPTADVVGFANITFVAPDSTYNGHTFRYMMVQKPSEQDDQIPFTKQFGLSPNMYESGISPWYPDYEHMYRLTSATLTNSKDRSTVQVSFDQDATIKLLLLTDFLSLSDVSPLHNEDWGTSLTTGKTFVIPHGFDMSFMCSSIDPSNLYLTQLINDLPESSRSAYQAAYYRIAREIFGNASSLDKMLALVDEFPYKDVDKKKLVEFLKLRFYQFSTYYNSEAFAQSLKQGYQPLNVALPFTSKEEYSTHNNDFINSCSPSLAVLSDVTATVIGSPTLKYEASNKDPGPLVPVAPVVAPCPVGFQCGDSGSGNAKKGLASLIVEVKTGNSDLEMQKSKYGNAFPVNLVGTKDGSSGYYQYNVKFVYSVMSGIVEDIAGPYYIIPAHSTVRFALTADVNTDGLIKDMYYVELAGFQPSGRVRQLPLQGRTNSLELGSLEEIKIVAPRSGENLIAGQNYKISWTGSSNKGYEIKLSAVNGHEYFIYNPERPRTSNGTSYQWTVGKVYEWRNDKGSYSYVEEDLEEGQYRVDIRYEGTNAVARGEYFNIASSASSTPPTATIIEKPILTMAYDPAHEEASLVSTFKVAIDSGSRSWRIQKEYAFWSYLTSSDNYAYSRGQSYDQPASTTDSGDGYYIIPANTKAIFTVKTFFNPKIMFSGVYSGSMAQVYLGDPSRNKTLMIPADIITNSLAIIGEKSPYVNDVSPKEISSNGTMLISGVRFSTTENNIVNLVSYSQVSECPIGYTCSGRRVYSVKSFDGTTLRFVPNIEPGLYYGQVTNPKTGDSNAFAISVSTSTTIQSVTPDKTTIDSGQQTILKYVIPSGAVSAKLNLYCPPGVTSQETSGVDHRDFCNTWSTFTGLPQSTSLKLFNSMAWPQHVVPNFAIYFENDPNYAVGVTSDVLVLPVAPANIRELIKATSTSSAAPIATTTKASSGLLNRTLSATRKAVSSVVSSASSLISGNSSNNPTPSPSSQSRSSAKSSPSNSPSPSPTRTVCPSGFSAYGNQCVRVYSPSPQPTLIINKVSSFVSPSPSSKVSPSPSPTSSSTPSPSPSVRISPTPTTAVSPRPSVSPTPTRAPAITPALSPTPVNSPSATVSPTTIIIVTPVATPSATVTVTPPSSVTPIATPSPSSAVVTPPKPSPSPSPVSIWSGQRSTASVFNAIETMVGYFLGN